MKIEKEINESFNESIKTIKESKKELLQLLEEIEKKGLITKDTKNQKDIPVIASKLQDNKFKNIIRRLKSKLQFVKDIPEDPLFLPEIPYIKIEANKFSKLNKASIKEKIDQNIKDDFEEESFFLLPFKPNIREKIKSEIQEKTQKLKANLSQLEELINENKTIENFWTFMINTTPEKEVLADLISAIIDYEENILNITEEELIPYVGKTHSRSVYEKIQTFKNIPEITFVTPMKTSLLLFNSYFSTIEYMVLSKYKKEENYTEEYKNFLKYLDKIKDILKMNIELTDSQKMLTFGFYKEAEYNVLNSAKPPLVSFLNTSEVGTGKTFTIPFVSILLAALYQSKYKKDSIFLFITEANLLLETLEKFKNELGIPAKLVKIITDIDEISTENKWCFHLISKNRMTNLTKEKADNLAKKLKKANTICHIIADEASYLKNPASATSTGYQILKSKLVKEKVLGIEMLMTATPISNDSSDVPYTIMPNHTKLSHLKRNHTGYLLHLKENISELTSINKDASLSLKEIVRLANKFPNRNVNIDKTKNAKIDPKSLLLLLHYMYTKNESLNGFFKGMNPEARAKILSEKYTENLEKIGLTTTVKKLGAPNHSGKKDIKTMKITTSALSYLSSPKAIDRIVNTENKGRPVQTNSIILDSNIFEVVAFIKIIQNSRKIGNFKKFQRLVEFLNQFNETIDKVEEEKFYIRHYLLMQILYDEEKINIKTETVKIQKIDPNRKRNKVVGTFYIEKISTNKHKYYEEIYKLTENPDLLYQKMITELNPTDFTKIKELEKEYEKTNSNKIKREIKNQIKRISEKLEKEIRTILPNKKEDTKKLLTETLKNDLETKVKELSVVDMFQVKSMVFSKYEEFLESIEEEILSRPKLAKALEDPTVKEQIFAVGSILETYSTLFQAAENLNMPIISQHLSKAAREIRNLLEQKGIKINNYKTKEFAEFISNKCSATSNLIKKVKRYATENKVPILAAVTYKNSITSIKDENDYVITGDMNQEKRKKIINQVNIPTNEKHIVATAQSILKGISFFYIPYGILPETPKNAEFRTQITGRLRSLFEHHIKEFNKYNMEDRKSYKRLILSNNKYFDIVSSELMVAFPNIQQSKNVLVELTKYISQHEKICGIKSEDTLSEKDENQKFKFNKDKVERFATEILYKKLDEFIKILRANKAEKEIEQEELFKIAEKYLDMIDEKNLRKTTIYSLLNENKKIYNNQKI